MYANGEPKVSIATKEKETFKHSCGARIRKDYGSPSGSYEYSVIRANRNIHHETEDECERMENNKIARKKHGFEIFT